MGNRVVHFEIPAENPERLTGFYGELFGWQIQKAEGFEYWIAIAGRQGEHGIDGAVMRRQAPAQLPINYVNVPSVDEWVERNSQLGGTIGVGKQAVSGMGWFAHLTDPEGNPIGIWQGDESAA